MDECEQFVGRQYDLCTGMGHDGRPAPLLTKTNKFRERHGLPPLSGPKKPAVQGTRRTIRISLTGVVKDPHSLPRKALRLANALAKAAAKGIPLVSDEQHAARLAVCEGCPMKQNDTCQDPQCGCNLSFKAKLATERCPQKKWPGDTAAG